jgi:predicted enzyme related to lactoylglutathione lyase
MGGEMPDPVVHFEIISKDAEKLHSFYSDVFQWKIDTNNEVNYGIVNNGGQGIDGGIGGVFEENYPGHVTFYISVADPAETLKKIESLGGTTVMPPDEIPGTHTTIAQFKDPAGNLIGLTKA